MNPFLCGFHILSHVPMRLKKTVVVHRVSRANSRMYDCLILVKPYIICESIGSALSNGLALDADGFVVLRVWSHTPRLTNLRGTLAVLLCMHGAHSV